MTPREVGSFPIFNPRSLHLEHREFSKIYSRGINYGRATPAWAQPVVLKPVHCCSFTLILCPNPMCEPEKASKTMAVQRFVEDILNAYCETSCSARIIDVSDAYTTERDFKKWLYLSVSIFSKLFRRPDLSTSTPSPRHCRKDKKKRGIRPFRGHFRSIRSEQTRSTIPAWTST